MTSRNSRGVDRDPPISKRMIDDMWSYDKFRFEYTIDKGFTLLRPIRSTTKPLFGKDTTGKIAEYAKHFTPIELRHK